MNLRFRGGRSGFEDGWLLVHFGFLQLLVILRRLRTIGPLAVVGSAGVSLGTCVALQDFHFDPLWLKFVAQGIWNFFIHRIARLEGLMFYLLLVRLDILLTPKDYSSSGFVVHFFRSHLVFLEKFSKVLIQDRL